jgi:hypothetical protein
MTVWTEPRIQSAKSGLVNPIYPVSGSDQIYSVYDYISLRLLKGVTLYGCSNPSRQESHDGLKQPAA